MSTERHVTTKEAPPPDSGEGIVHEYDGILEADNHLPRWWLMTLYGAIAFSALYWMGYEAFKMLPSPREAYAVEQAKAAAAEAEKLKAMGAASDENLVAMAKNVAAASEGKEVFTKNCVSCHAANGGGGIGPNLTDGAWLHGGKPMQVYATIKDGYVKGGMPGWGALIGEERVRLAAAYVLSIKGTNVPGGKAPQGAPEP
ncbi:cbb3-type cytochrome c oxidase N-terminal domain-containing protein [Polyangium sp. y55x31]|uniref:cbb3-type cytochrome c oxidase N-terminal domain-containing protein n=1 Tax=Polyangium sp. y55x31 TaxID=3042688 RepID=UPI002482A222|nr:cbb3-type cytochrome c oxidase N-terminal domain-containing protein [Polyangium sp. y55x31]MDI1475940.1 cbb3-type cytochrome c oxidase N-terminal domain-containing protein [Polyangium sp. y55x31]